MLFLSNKLVERTKFLALRAELKASCGPYRLPGHIGPGPFVVHAWFRLTWTKNDPLRLLKLWYWMRSHGHQFISVTIFPVLKIKWPQSCHMQFAITFPTMYWVSKVILFVTERSLLQTKLHQKTQCSVVNVHMNSLWQRTLNNLQRSIFEICLLKHRLTM